MAIALTSSSRCPIGKVISFTSPVISPRAKAFKIHTRLSGPGRGLLPKRFAGIGLLLSIHRHTVIIPHGTVSVRGKKTFVCMIHQSGMTRGHFIRAKPRVKGGVIVRHKLNRGRRIMVRNCRGLIPKVLMRPVRTNSSGTVRTLETRRRRR